LGYAVPLAIGQTLKRKLKQTTKRLLMSYPIALRGMGVLQWALPMRRAHVNQTLGWLWQEQGNLEQAEARFLQVTRIQPDQSDGHVALARIQLELGKAKAARRNAERALALHPSAQMLLQIGSCYQALGDLDTANRMWQRALDLDPYNLESHKAIWLGLTQTGDIEHSCQYYASYRRCQQQLAELHGVDWSRTRYLPPIWSQQIGHTAHLDTYFKIRLLGWQPKARVVLFAPPEKTANPYYLRLWQPYVDIVTTREELARVAPFPEAIEDRESINDIDGGRCLWLPLAGAAAQEAWNREARQPLLRFPAEDLNVGHRFAADAGMSAGDWFVSFHVREIGFYGKRDASQSFRNADVKGYLPAMQEIVDRGGWVVRLGDPTMAPLPSMPHVLDYAHSNARSDLLDVYFCSQCRFFIGSQSGLSIVSNTFGVPTLMTNWSSISMPWYGNNTFLLKLLRLKNSGRILTFAEMLKSKLGLAQYGPEFVKAGIEIIDNTPEELRLAVIEMLERVDQTRAGGTEDDENETLQRRFRRLGEAHGVSFTSRLARDFLSAHRDLLDDVSTPSRSP
jgi:putative glycosyltransferase (TIGR04372 family)